MNKVKSTFLFHVFILIGISFLKDGLSQSIGNGEDGSPNISGTINHYASLQKDAYHCNFELTVKDNASFTSGDLILIIQMQGAEIINSNNAFYGEILTYNNCGNYEYAIVDGLSDNDGLTLRNPLLHNYSSDKKVQIVKIPQYMNPVIEDVLTCPSWNGETGGIIAFDAKGIVTLQADICATGKGFRGGEVIKGQHFFAYSHDYVAESYNPDWFSLKGEGVADYGIFPFTSGRGSAANAGGGGNIHTSGGGGGGNGGKGGNGGWGYPMDTLGNEFDVQGLGGKELIYSDNKIFMGAGGGAGHEHFGNGTAGASGGGIVLITADYLKGNSHSVWANGNGSASSGGYGDGAGGAGSGGTVLLSLNQLDDTLNIYIQGGNGGSSILKGFGPGGGGGGGACLLAQSSMPNKLEIYFEGGMAGLAGGNYYGADAGSNGSILYNVKVPFNNYYSGVKAEFDYNPTIITDYNSLIFFINKSYGATNYYWDFGDGENSIFENVEHLYNPGSYSTLLIANDSLCSDTITTNIDYKIIPNVISPNGDNINDEFIFPSFNNQAVDIKIFSRWGILLYDVSSNNIHWNAMFNGSPVENGIYYYCVSQNANKIYYGFIEVLR